MKRRKAKYVYATDTIGRPYEAHISETHAEYLYTERKLLTADEDAKKCKARLWSVTDIGEVYFKLFPRPVSAALAFKDFMQTADYMQWWEWKAFERALQEGKPVELYPLGFIVQGWDARHVRRSREDIERGFLEELEYWNDIRPFRRHPRRHSMEPKYTLLMAVWFPILERPNDL